MEFCSPRFLGLLLPTLVLLALLRPGRPRRILLLLASCLSYAAWDWRYLFLLLLISGVDYVAALGIQASDDARVRWRWLLLSLVSNLGVLAYFKYANFFLFNNAWEIVLPAGISFYIFKTLSYTIDVYRKQISACRSWLDYSLFVTFFPDLIAGPIVRASVFLPQLSGLTGLSWRRLAVGANLLLQGLTKKLLLADHLGELVHPVFARPLAFSSQSAWMAALAFTIQIYLDFSGYSDMATGTAYMLGYDLPMNFRMPYLSTSLREFWQRWHITLSQWLRDYLYIPLGGNRKFAGRNVFLTMLLGGLWHGAGWNFLLWGGLHGLGLALCRRMPAPKGGWPRPLGWLSTFLFVMLALVLFRSESVPQAMQMYARLFTFFEPGGQRLENLWFWPCLLATLLGQRLSVWLEQCEGRPAWLGWLGLEICRLPLAGPYLCVMRAHFFSGWLLTSWLGLIYFFASTSYNPFIYFRF